MELHKDKLGLVGLTAIVFGSIIGGAVYNLPQNLASVSAIGPSILSWCITGAGILFLALTFKILADKRPDLNSGIYQYAEEGFGNYIGFNMACGYWMAAAMGNVALAVLLNDAFGYFFPVLLNHGIETILFGSCFIWIMFFIVSAGIRGASIINTVISILKFLSITLIIGILLTHDKTHLFEGDFWGETQNIGTIADQIRNSMFITLWAFIGIEGAVIVANRARKKSDVGKASVIGFLCSLVIYLLISTLSYGALPRTEMATLSDPSIGYVLKALVGQWGIVYIACAVIVSLLGGWISWTIIVSEVPSTAAR
ncbi:MAG: amino acid permease, partial [Tannerellaceae bacterium]